MSRTPPPLRTADPARSLRRDVMAGLARRPKRLPSKYFYDARGSALFEAITRQPEYYLTRVEQALLVQSMPAIAARIGHDAHVVEYGSGSGLKTGTLLAGLDAPRAYTPVEISPKALAASVARLQKCFPGLAMHPLHADFTQPLTLPLAGNGGRVLVFFPGSTLGNFRDDDAVALMRSMATTIGDDGMALIGIDLVKNPARIEAAYNDAAGVTAAFTLNLLARLNRELGADFDLDAFAHRARYEPERERIETDIVSLRDQTVHVAGEDVAFAADEAMRVEYSHKYRDARFAALAAQAGLRVIDGWGDARTGFGLRLLAR